MKASDFYDLEVLKRSTGNDADFTKHMIELFNEHAPKQLEELKEAASKSDWEKVGKTAHKLKSSIRSMGIHALADSILAFEQDGKNETNLESIPERLLEFEKKLMTTINFLSQEL